jgi:hypothetical protein
MLPQKHLCRFIGKSPYKSLQNRSRFSANDDSIGLNCLLANPVYSALKIIQLALLSFLAIYKMIWEACCPLMISNGLAVHHSDEQTGNVCRIGKKQKRVQEMGFSAA